MVAQVNFRGEYVTPITLENSDPYLFLTAYIAIFFIGHWMLRLTGKKDDAMRIALTGVGAAVGAMLGALFVAIPASLFSELVFPIEDRTLNTFAYTGAACCWGWWAHVIWSERNG